MNNNIDEVTRGIDDTFDTARVLVKTLVVAYNDEVIKLLKETIEKSQEIERLKKQIKGEE